MSVKSRYELRVTIQVDGAGDFFPKPLIYDELQFDLAQKRYAEYVRNAKTQVGKTKTFTTADGNEFSAVPHTFVIECWQYKIGRSDNDSLWASRPSIVGETDTESGMRDVVTTRDRPVTGIPQLAEVGA